jgi:hypothetical protein
LFLFSIPVVNNTFGNVNDLRKPDCDGIAGFSDILCDVDRYCGIAEVITKSVCLETGILELWGLDDPNVYEELTEDSILEKLNQVPSIRYIMTGHLQLSIV